MNEQSSREIPAPRRRLNFTRLDGAILKGLTMPNLHHLPSAIKHLDQP